MVFCSYFVVPDHGCARQPPCRAAAWSVGPLDAFALAARLELSLRSLQLFSFAEPVRFSTTLTSPLVDRHILARPFDIDVDVVFSVYTAREKEVESEDRQQDNHNDGHRSHTATRIFSHISSLLGMDAGKKHHVR
jgi:hypothetical protein